MRQKLARIALSVAKLFQCTATAKWLVEHHIPEQLAIRPSSPSTTATPLLWPAGLCRGAPAHNTSAPVHRRATANARKNLRATVSAGGVLRNWIEFEAARVECVQTDGRSPLDLSVLRDLSGAGRTWRQLDVVDETGSTNADLIARGNVGADIAGAVLLAEHQTAGRGRHGRTWSAPARSQIAMSVGVAIGTMPPTAWGWLPLLAGVAVADTLFNVCNIQVGLKWPNDVLVGDRKLAGILAEVAAPAGVIVLGLGLNVTMRADEVAHPAATSLTMIGSSATDRNILVRSLLAALGTRIEQWTTSGGADDALRADYLRYSRTIGTRVKAAMPGDRQIVGVAQSIDEMGRLQIDTGSTVVTVSAGDITHLRPLPDVAAG